MTRQEVPHSIAVVIEEWERDGELVTDPRVAHRRARFAEGDRDRQGRRAPSRRSAPRAREEMEQLLGAKVFLDLRVKVLQGVAARSARPWSGSGSDGRYVDLQRLGHLRVELARDRVGAGREPGEGGGRGLAALDLHVDARPLHRERVLVVVLVHQVERVGRGGRDARGREGACSACRPRWSSSGTSQVGAAGPLELQAAPSEARPATTARSTMRRIRARSLRDAVMRVRPRRLRAWTPDRALLVACLDLTSLGDDEDDAAIDALCARGPLRPVPDDAGASRWRPSASGRGGCRAARGRSGADAGRASPARPAGSPVPDAPLARPAREIEEALDAGADEVDVPINRFLIDDPDALRGELDATRAAAGDATWKAILETGRAAARRDPLPRRRRDRGRSRLPQVLHRQGGPGATPEAAAILADRGPDAGRPVGLKLSGGIRGVGQATNYLALVRGLARPAAGRRPTTFRIGASALLDALVA